MKKIKVLQLRYITTLVRTDEMVYKDDFSMNTYHKCDYCDNNNGTFMTCNICAKTWCAPNQHCFVLKHLFILGFRLINLVRSRLLLSSYLVELIAITMIRMNQIKRRQDQLEEKTG